MTRGFGGGGAYNNMALFTSKVFIQFIAYYTIKYVHKYIIQCYYFANFVYRPYYRALHPWIQHIFTKVFSSMTGTFHSNHSHFVSQTGGDDLLFTTQTENTNKYIRCNKIIDPSGLMANLTITPSVTRPSTGSYLHWHIHPLGHSSTGSPLHQVTPPLGHHSLRSTLH